MDDLKEQIIQYILENKGGSREAIQQIMDRIVYQESKGNYTARQLAHKDGRRGPGTGGFQFEKGWGYKKDKSKRYIYDGNGNKVVESPAGAGIAANRLSNLLKKLNIDAPEWLEDFKNVTWGDIDAFDTRRLSREQQEILFLGDILMKDKADIGKVLNGEQPLEDFWIKYHWAGGEDQEAERRKQWRAIEDHLKKHYKKTNKYPESFTYGTFIPPPMITDPSIPGRHFFDRSEAPGDPLNWIGINSNNYTSIDPTKTSVGYSVDANRNRIPEKNFDRSSLNDNLKQYSLEESIPTESTNREDYFSRQNQFSLGGISSPSKIRDTNLNKFDEGGSHEQNPHGGVPLGRDSEGIMNTVEEGETMFDLPELGKYIFSDRLGLSGRMKPKYQKSINAFNDGGKIHPNNSFRLQEIANAIHKRNKKDTNHK